MSCPTPLAATLSCSSVSSTSVSTACDGSRGVVSVLPTMKLPVTSSNTTRSVNVPPISTPILYCSKGPSISQPPVWESGSIHYRSCSTYSKSDPDQYPISLSLLPWLAPLDAVYCVARGV